MTLFEEIIFVLMESKKSCQPSISFFSPLEGFFILIRQQNKFLKIVMFIFYIYSKIFLHSQNINTIRHITLTSSKFTHITYIEKT